MNGVLVINKPAQFTSFDVVAVVRKLSGQRKIGHTGTLDPNATGVLPLLLGNATKAQDIIPNHDKAYRASFRLGITTDTLDIWGKITSQKDSNLTLSEIENALSVFRGEIEQIPPMFSAVSVGGKRLYDLARQGIEVERKARKITIYENTLLGFDEKTQSGELFIKCSKGTYIRTIIDDLGSALGCGAAMTALNREQACGYSLSDSITLDEAKALSENGELENRLLSTESLFAEYPELSVSDAQAKRFYNGGALDSQRTRLAQNTPEGTILRVKSRENRFLGLGKLVGGEIKIYKHF